MNEVSVWLLRTLLAGGGLLFLAWLALALTPDPARRQRLAAWTFRAAVLAAVLGLFPAWLRVPVSFEDAPSVTAAVEPVEDWVDVPEDDLGERRGVSPPSQVSEQSNPSLASSLSGLTPRRSPEDTPRYSPWQYALGAYAVLAALFAAQLALALIGLAHLRRSSIPAPEFIATLAADLAGPFGIVPSVRLCSRLSSPVCFGWRRPTILLPTKLAATASADELRWILAHELDHLRRGDPRTGLWVGLARALYFPLPWFWAVRKELRLAQEYLADAAAAAGRPADYAAFLVSLSGLPSRPRLPLGAVAVRAGRTDLYRRVSMLTTNGPVRDGVSRSWTLMTASGTIAAAVALSGLGLAEDKRPAARGENEVTVADEKPKDKPRGDGDKKPETRTFEMKVVGPGELQELSKAVNAALEKGDVAAAKEAMAKLQKALANPPKVMMIRSGDMMMTAPAMAPQAPRADVKKLEEKLEGMKKALESVKDNPEAREALEKVMSEFRRQLETAKKPTEFHKLEAPFGVGGTFLDPAKMKQLEAEMAARRTEAEAYIKDLEAKLAKAEGEGKAKLQAQLEAAKSQLEATRMRVRAFEGNPGFFKAGGEPGVASARAPGEGRLGITIEAVPAVLAEHLGLASGFGLVITSVRTDSPAAKAGIKANDILWQIERLPISDAAAVAKILAAMPDGKKLDIVVVRKGKEENFKDVVIPPVEKRREGGGGRAEGGARVEGGGDWTRQIVTINNGDFKIVAENKEASYTVVGTLEDGKPVVRSVTVGKGEAVKDLSQLSKSDRAAVESLLKNVSGGRRK